ncbi:E3 ubiquitin protein ligase DRIP2 [Dichanthelium oligosanthes]|uniref:E3 ubiquitin protein ligase DRIP2 n=1 Tax=Dichanthelium oligosanthes TaxID=888268 RepID=A0A1E5VM70_9POAL|nr:E3 ubiquitin protein ligase DRIP2 [Dichanthelium oligosanthes]
MVKRDLLASCMTCPLCRRLLRDATTISECLHTFCRKCIYQKFNDEEVECCPVCKIDLGCTPTEKLRADHSLQDVRSKLFPFKRKKIKAEEVPSPISLPTKRKERSISSLVVNTPKVKPTGLTGRRTRAVARKAAAAALRGLGPVIEDPVKKEIDSCDSHSHNSSLPANSSKALQTRRQIPSNAEASNHSSNKDTEGDSKELADKAELWQPLNCLVEAANRTKSYRSSSQNPVVKGEQLNGSASSTYASKTKARENLQKSKIEDDKKDVPMPPVLPKRRGQGASRRRRELQAPADAKPDTASAQNEKKFSSIWFSLVASYDQQGDPPLPQIPSPYLRIKDGNVPASSIQKYLMQKLSLPNESEVEIKCCEQPVNPAQPLRNLVELWLKGRTTQTAQTTTGSSAKEFVMVLTYGRPKAPAL